MAVRVIVDREREIQAFVPREYWSVDGTFETANGEKFTAKLSAGMEIATDRPTRARSIIGGEADARSLVDELLTLKYAVGVQVRRKDQARNPSPPFTTSTLQQEANRKLGYSAARTMAVAQQLYEGIDIGDGGTIGLITYMRTDSGASRRPPRLRRGTTSRPRSARTTFRRSRDSTGRAAMLRTRTRRFGRPAWPAGPRT